MPDPLPLDVLAEEFGAVAGRIERESGLRIAAAIADMRRIDAERELRFTNLERLISDRLAGVKNGDPGASVTLSDVAPLIDSAVQAAVAGISISVPKDGAPGRDVDPDMIRSFVDDAVAAAVAKIPPPQAGKDADPEAVQRLVGEAIAALPPPPRGESGMAGESVTLEQLAPLVDAAVALEVSKIAVPSGEKGDRGEPGASVTVEDVAPAVEAAVAKAIPEIEARLIAALPPGIQGEPGKGLTVEDVSPLIEDVVSRHVAGLPPPARGERGAEGPPGKLPAAGEWCDRVHYEGEVATLDGSTFQAVRDTGRAPPHDDWRCIASSGRDGLDGRSFRIRGTYALGEDYLALDTVALNGASFAAKRDNPGPCPGDGWQMIASQGKSGKPGERGLHGLKGDRGAPGPSVDSVVVDDEGLLSLRIGDGSLVTCDLYPLLDKLGR